MAMIVRDEAKTILPCLKSWWGHVDEAVIVDTGSKDKTVQKIKRFAEKNPQTKLTLLHFEWCDDFGKARQFAWDHLTTDWGVWCDADDTIEGAENFRRLAATALPHVSSFIFEYDYARDDRDNCICRLSRERLTRRGIGEYWYLPIHEVMRLPVDMLAAPEPSVVYRHHRDPAKVTPDRNRRILLADYERAVEEGRPPDQRTVLYLGSEFLIATEWEQATKFLREYLRGETTPDEVAQAKSKLTDAYLAQGKYRRAELAAYGALNARPDWADGYLALMQVAMHKRDYRAAITYAQRALSIGPPETMLITNPWSYEFLPYAALSEAFNALGDVPHALEATEQALRLMPGEPNLLHRYEVFTEHVKGEETAELVLKLREVLVRHDENAKAWEMLDSVVPYYAARNPRVLAAKADQAAMTLHGRSDEAYRAYYGDNPNEQLFDVHGIPIEEVPQRFGRVRFLEAGLKKHGAKKVLDAGCNDGWIAKYLTTQGFKVSGVELHGGAVKRARERGGFRVREGCIEDVATLYPNEKFDAVYMFEVIEHLQDPEATLAALEAMLNPGGQIFLSTPNGAFERGNIPDWWHVEAKGHLRVYTSADFADLARARGEVEGFCVDEREGLLYSCYTAGPRAVPGQPDIPLGGPVVNFYIGHGWQDFSPRDIDEKGLGGSETAAVKMAQGLADRGCHVTVYAGKGAGSGLYGQYGQVLYRPADEWDASEQCDLLVSSRIPEIFDRPIGAREKWLWMHDTDCADRLTMRRAAQIDRVLVLSEWHRDHVATTYPFIAGKLALTCNGVDNERFDPKATKKPQLVYTSSPDRGLDILLDVWPAVREAVPDAELHHAYAPVYYEIAAQNPSLMAFRHKIDVASSADGVVAHTSLNAPDLAKLFSESKVWAYPSWASPQGVPFHEVSCITALEAQAAGLVCVAPARGALPETLRSYHALPDEPPTDEWKALFTKQIIAALRGELTTSEPVDQSWQSVAGQWFDWMDVEPLAEAA